MTMRLVIGRSGAIRGEVSVPGDKSISHRAVMLGAIAEGTTEITGFLFAGDTLNTLKAVEAMGARSETGMVLSIDPARPGRFSRSGTEMMLAIQGVGLRGLQAPEGPLDMGNSGTGMRLLLGILAGQSFSTLLTGDDSLSRRPMDRIAQPLGLMGISVEGQGERCTPPLTIHGGRPRAIDYHSPMPSAQVKSAVMLAGLYADGVTSVTEPALSRDHTERMLRAFGAEVTTGLTAEGRPAASVLGGPSLQGQAVAVPGDFSSAAYPLAAALLCPGSEVTIHGVIINPTRAGLLGVLRRMGAQVAVSDSWDEAGELVGDARAMHSGLEGTSVSGAEIPCLIDEVPLLSVLATQAEGTTVIRDAQELRVKESDRLALTARGLVSMGANVEELPDGLIIEGPTPLRGAQIDAAHDHRIAMSFAIAGLVADGETAITGAETIATSFPEFAETMRALGASLATTG